MPNIQRTLGLALNCCWAVAGAAALATSLVAQSLPAAKDVNLKQRIDLLGSYRASDGRVFGVTPRADPESWRFIDYSTGESHRLYPDDAVNFHSAADWAAESPVAIRYHFEINSHGSVSALIVCRERRKALVAARLAFQEDTTTFLSGSIHLFGKLVLPLRGHRPFPVVVFVHGSENTSAVAEEEFPYLMAAYGMASFVYDKRGTGRSEGQYFQMFDSLSTDLVAAVHWLQSQEMIDPSRIGLAGFSQGGWVAPLAAMREPAVKYVVVGYGLTTPVAEQDSLQAPLLVQAKGFDTTAVRQFQELNAAIHKLAREGFANGWEEVEAKMAEYGPAPWFMAMKASETWAGSLLEMGIDKAKATVPAIFTYYFQPYYDPMPTLEALSAPMLWLIAGDDIQAPPGPTLEALDRLKKRGKPIDVVVFPHADHGMTQFIVHDRQRVTTKYADGYYPMMVKWILRHAKLPAN